MVICWNINSFGNMQRAHQSKGKMAVWKWRCLIRELYHLSWHYNLMVSWFMEYNGAFFIKRLTQSEYGARGSWSPEAVTLLVRQHIRLYCIFYSHVSLTWKKKKNSSQLENSTYMYIYLDFASFNEAVLNFCVIWGNIFMTAAFHYVDSF